MPGAGIEPARLAAGDFESPASTNFTTRARERRAILWHRFLGTTFRFEKTCRLLHIARDSFIVLVIKMIDRIRKTCQWASISAMALLCTGVEAAPFEVKIHDELIAPHLETTFEAEVKLYRPPVGSTLPSNVVQSRFEVAYGLSQGSEVSFNLFTSHFDEKTQVNGGKVAHIYIPEHDESGWFHYGVKNEVNSVNGLNEPHAVFYELTPIVGFHVDRWRLTLNPSLDFYFNGNRKTVFAPAGKLTYAVTEHHSVGVEYYSEMGPLHQPTPFAQRPDAAYLVWDTSTPQSNYSIGVGKGVNAVGDKWILKLIGSVPINF